jgi:arginine deiminase
MHLDTVFTQIDVDKFAVFTDYPFVVYKLQKGKKEIEKIEGTLEQIFGNIFGTDVQMIICGNGDPIHAAREQ